jgi:arginyl-tRNA--protein-N-Asp/Glu arginylyltransferase
LNSLIAMRCFEGLRKVRRYQKSHEHPNIEDTKRVMSTRISKKDRQFNGHQKKNIKKNNNNQRTTQKTKD